MWSGVRAVVAIQLIGAECKEMGGSRAVFFQSGRNGQAVQNPSEACAEPEGATAGGG